MPHNDVSSHSPSRTTSETKQIHEKNCPLKVNGNEDNKRPNNISKKNVALSALNIHTAQQDKIRETCLVHQRKTQSEIEQKTETLVKNKEKKELNLGNPITVRSSKSSKISCASCVLESEQSESTIKDLKIQMQELGVELSNCKNENQLLRKEINRAKSVIKRDIGRNVESFEDIVKRMTEDSWIGQQEKIVSLKKELRELKEELREKGLKPPSPVKRRETISPEKISNDRKVHWRLTLERRSILRQKEREMRDLIEDRDRMKEKVELMLDRNKDMEQQVESVRQEFKELKNYSNGKFISRLHEIEKKAKLCLDEKSKLRRSVAEEATKGKQLLTKIGDLKAELDSQKIKFEITKETLSKMKSEEIAILSLGTEFESEAVSGLKDIDETLGKVEKGHKKNEKHLNLLIDLIFMFEELFSQQRQRTPLSDRPDDGLSSFSSDTFEKEILERDESQRTDSTNERIMATAEKDIEQNAETAMQDTKEKLEVILTPDDQQTPTDESTKLEDDYDKIVKLLKDKEEENLKKSEHIYDLLDKFQEEIEEMLRKSSECWKTAWQLKMMSLKNKRLKKLVKICGNGMQGEQHEFCHTTWDELINKGELVCNILGNENKFLKRLITSVAQSKAYDFDLYTFACKRNENSVEKNHNSK